MTLLLVHAAATWALVGLIWTVQVVHYPLFGAVGREAFRAYHAGHTRTMSWIVAPLMGVELCAALALAATPPPGVPRGLALAGLALVGVAWLMTALVAVPLHGKLAAGLEERALARLVATNWVRTAAWTARGLLAAGMIARAWPPAAGGPA